MVQKLSHRKIYQTFGKTLKRFDLRNQFFCNYSKCPIQLPRHLVLRRGEKLEKSFECQTFGFVW